MSQLHRVVYAEREGGQGIHKPGRWNPSSLSNQLLKNLKLVILQNDKKKFDT